MPAILYGDIEQQFIDALKAWLTGRPEQFAQSVSVRQRVPGEGEHDPWPTSGRLVVVRDDGGPVLGDLRATARLGVQVWAADEGEASDLANLVAAFVGSWRSSAVRRSTLTSRPYSVDDPTGRPKQYLTAELMVRGRALPA